MFLTLYPILQHLPVANRTTMVFCISNAPFLTHSPGVGIMTQRQGAINGTGLAVPSSSTTVDLPQDAASTLYVDGLPEEMTKRELAHIFRGFEGYQVGALHQYLQKGIPLISYIPYDSLLLIYSQCVKEIPHTFPKCITLRTQKLQQVESLFYYFLNKI